MEQELGVWIEKVRSESAVVEELLGRPEREIEKLGYGNTLREILQQPVVWRETASRMLRQREQLLPLVDRGGADGALRGWMLTGSGSSYYVGECLAPALRALTGRPVVSVPAGDLLARKQQYSLHSNTSLLVSFARSGNSPESAAVVDGFLDEDPECRHLFVTCNAEGHLARDYSERPQIRVVLLHPRTNDRSLVMTSSFTSMFLAGLFLGCIAGLSSFEAGVGRLAAAARTLMLGELEKLASATEEDFRYAVFLGSGCRAGSARESGLKMMEMTGGHVRTMAETYLGVRHGPMSAIHPDTLLVCFLSVESPAREYELDLLSELKRKRLGSRCIVVGESVPGEVLRGQDIVVGCGGAGELGDLWLPALDVLVGQWLAFFRCRAVGLHPDAPSPGGVIHRVVETFRIHS